MNLHSIFYIIGIFLCLLASTMLIPMAMDIWLLDGDWENFAISFGITGFCGVLLMLANKQTKLSLNGREAFLLTSLSWIMLCLFAALPFKLALPHLSITDVIFESVSGLTTTGASVFTNLDTMPKGILLWRALLHFIGGVGIIVMAISILPILKIGGMQLFRLESSEKDKALPSAAQISKYIVFVQIILTSLCAFGYYKTGMAGFDSIANAMTTTSTGGFTTTNNSFMNYPNFGPEIIAIIFMILGCLPLVIYVKMIRGDIFAVIRDSQTMTFIKITLLIILAISVYLFYFSSDLNAELFVDGVFTVISFLSSTGFVTVDYSAWGEFALGFLMFISFIGGCAGSTTGGIKIFRFQIMYRVAKAQIYQLIYPNGVFTVEYNNQSLTDKSIAAVITFFFVFIISSVIICLGLLLCGLDFVTALSATVSTIANVGVGVGDVIGATGSFAPLPDTAKWILSLSMLLGRLEFFALLVLVIPRFWRV